MSNTLPLISILIVNFNGARYLYRLFDSISRQSYQNIEVVIVDNASTDDSLAILSKITERNKRLKEVTSVVKNVGNFGFALGNNIGVQHCQGRYVFFLNSDEDWTPVAGDPTCNEFKNESTVLTGGVGVVIGAEPSFDEFIVGDVLTLAVKSGLS